MQIYLVEHTSGNDFVEEKLAFTTKQKAIDYLREIRDMAIAHDALVEDKLDWGVKAVWVTDENGWEHEFILDNMPIQVH